MKRGEKRLSKKLKFTLFIAIILSVFAVSYCIAANVVYFIKKDGHLTFQGVTYNVENFGYVISDWKGANGDQDGRQSLIQTKVTELLGAKLNHFEGDNPIKFKGAICMSHGTSNAVGSSGIYYIKTVIDLDYDSQYKSFIIKTYDSKGNKKVTDAANTAAGREKAAKISYAIMQNDQMTTSGTSASQLYSKYKNQVTKYLREAIEGKMISASSIFLGQNEKLDEIDNDSLPSSQDPNISNTFGTKIKEIKNFKGLTSVSKVTATEKDTVLKIGSTPYIVVGPFKIHYGGSEISSIKIEGKTSSSVRWTESGNELGKESSWKKELKDIPNCKYFYLAFSNSELPEKENEEYEITVHQEGITYCKARMVLLEISKGQQLAMVAYGGEHKSGQVKLSYTITHKEKAKIIIIKQDRGTSAKISGVGIKVYGVSSDGSGSGWVRSNGSFVTKYEDGTEFTTNKEGKVTVSGLAPGTYYIYETKTAKGYSLENQRHFYQDSRDPMKKAGHKSIVYLGTQKLGRVTIRTRTFNQYKNPKLTVRKVDYDNPSKKLNGVKFGIYLNGKGWAVYDSDTKSITYDKNHKTFFETGKSYCGEKAKAGEFTLTNLLIGDYKVIELETTSDYLLSEQKGYDSNKKFVRCGRTSYVAGYTTVYKSDGKSKYNFLRVKYADKTKNDLFVDYIHLDWYESFYKATNGDIMYGTNYATYVVKNKASNTDTSLTIRKSDKNSGEEISGAKFKVLVKLLQDKKIGTTTFAKNTFAWVQSKQGGLTTDVSKALEVVTNEEGIANLTKIPYGQYYVYETETAQGYSMENQVGYNLGKPSDYKGTFLNGNWAYIGSKKITSDEATITLDAQNLKTSLKIVKKDGTSNNTQNNTQDNTSDDIKDDFTDGEDEIVDNTDDMDDSVDRNVYLGGAKIKIYGTNLGNGTSGWLKKTGDQYAYVSYNDSSTFTTDSKTGEINIEGISKGDYYIYEIEAPEGYFLNKQDGYKVAQPGSSSITQADWVYLGKSTLTIKNNQVEIEAENNKYIDIKGKVWVDSIDGNKDQNNKNNNIYDSKDTLLSDVTVKLVQNDAPNKVLATVKTNKSGEYVISKTSDNKKITVNDVENCHIEFSYDNKQYVVAKAFAGNDNVSSKAKVYQISNADLNDSNLTGNGVAVTYIGDDKNYKLSKYYSEETGSIENINLGLVKKLTPSHSIDEEIAYVKIVKGNYTFKYKYGDNAVIDGSDKTQSGVRFQNPATKAFTQPIYPTDIAYNVANGFDGNEDNSYKVYIVYKVLIKNTCTHNEDYIYKENGAYLDTLSITCDSRYELSNATMNDDGDDDFGLWQQQGGQAMFNINGATDKAFNRTNGGIGPGETEEVYVQFKVKNDALIQLSQGENVSIKTTVRDWAWHSYERNDINWQDEESYTHQSLPETRTNSALSIKLELADTRKVSGVVFEDNKDNSRPNERIGDGKYTDDENKLSSVSVTLMEVVDDGSGGETYKTASLYNGNIYYDSTTGKWKANKKEAHITVTDNPLGTYTLEGIVPGKYYLKFVYGDGTTELKKLDGSSVSETIATKSNGQKIESSKYKSTILTGAAKDVSDDYWYLRQDKNANYSVATDTNIENRMNSTAEIKNSTSNQAEVIEATSPKMNINFEYSISDEIDYNNKNQLYGNCSGMSFGIIERPHVDIQLEKKVQSVKFTLSNGTTLINGDENDSPYLARIDDRYVKLELKDSYMYGSQAQVRYELKIKNNSEIDYATPSYYKYGTTNTGTPVTTTVTKIIDHLDNTGCDYTNIDNRLQKSESDDDYQDGKQSYFTSAALEYNKKYKSQLLKVQEKELIPMVADASPDKSNSTETYVMSINRLLSDGDKANGWESTSEIIGIKNVTNTSQYNCIMGNYKVGDTVSRVNGGTNETDNGNGVISISVPTGSDKSYTKYIFGGTMIIILGIGIICIKKFVL